MANVSLGKVFVPLISEVRGVMKLRVYPMGAVEKENCEPSSTLPFAGAAYDSVALGEIPKDSRGEGAAQGTMRHAEARKT